MTTTTEKSPIPDWLVKKCGMKAAIKLYRELLDRWSLVSYNSDPDLNFPVQLEVMREFLWGTATEIVWFAGNRGAKSQGGAACDVAFATGIVPLALGGHGFEDKTDPQEPVEIWVSSLSRDMSRDIMKQKLELFIPRDQLVGAWGQRDFMFKLPNRSTIGLKSQEQGVDMYMGTSRPRIHLDEEHDEAIVNECLARIMDCGGKILMTLTPMHGMTYTHDRYWLEAGMEADESTRLEGVEGLRWKQTKNFETLRVFHTRTEDNPFLNRKAVQLIAAKWTDAGIRRVRLGGLHTLLKGSHVFPVEEVTKYIELARKPIEEDRAIGLKIFQQPVPGATYKIGVDTGKGKAKGDWSVAVVTDPLNRTVVAKLRARVEAITFAIRVLELGYLYNKAEIVAERQDHGILLIQELRRLHYPRIWRRRTVGKLLDETLDDYGFSTDVVGKPQVVSAVLTAVQDRAWDIPDREIVDEFTHFIHYDDKLPEGKERHKVIGKCGAMKGKFDDCIIALGLAIIGCQSIGINTAVRGPSVDSRPDQIGTALYERNRRIKGRPVRVMHGNEHNFRIRQLGGGRR